MLALYLILTVLMLIVYFKDVTSYTIPNWLNLVILLLYPALLLIAPEPVDWLSGIYGLLAVFAVGFVIFALGIMGGGDIKLLCICALWCGFGQTLLAFLVYTALLGGALSLLLIGGRLYVTWLASKRENPPEIPRLLSYGEPAPYGLAIATGFLIVLWTGKLPGMGLTIRQLTSIGVVAGT